MAAIEVEARKYALTILGGTVLALDPASGGTSDPGWAVYHRGVLLESGTLGLAGGRVQYRLKDLYCQLSAYECDVMVVEQLRGSGRTHIYLLWSVGVAVAATCPKLLLEMPVSCWKKHAGKAHVKSDENDAKAIGDTLIAMAARKYGR